MDEGFQDIVDKFKFSMFIVIQNEKEKGEGRVEWGRGSHER
jgi:hypothetical protein